VKPEPEAFGVGSPKSSAQFGARILLVDDSHANVAAASLAAWYAHVVTDAEDLTGTFERATH
jgi:hypothetical protein